MQNTAEKPDEHGAAITPENATDVDSYRIEHKANMLSIPRELKKPLDTYGYIACFAILTPLLACIIAAPLAWMYISPLAIIPVWVVMGIYIYKLTIVMHDCAHKTLFKNQKMNERIGNLCGLFLLSDFKTFRQLHWLHHQKYGEDADPQGRDYMHLADASKGLLFWHLIRPLFGYNLFKLGQFKPEMDGMEKSAKTPSRSKSLAKYAMLHVPLLLIITAGGKLWWLAPMYPAAAASVGLFLSQIRGFCEHIADPDQKSEAFVRTHLPNPIDRFFFYTLNFNYHVEHHLYPNIPCCHLPKVYEMTKTTIHTDDTISPSIIHTILHRFKEAS